MSIGNKIADLRKKQKLTQKDLAQELNVSDKVISRWETGASLPDVEMMKKLAQAFNVTIAELYDALDEDDGNSDEKENYERIWQYYDYERIWRYKRSTIIAASLFALATLVWYIVLLFGLYDIIPSIYPYTLNSIVNFIFIAIIIALVSVSIICEIVSAISLHSFSKTKYYRTLYTDTLKKYIKIYVIVCSVSFVLCLLPYIISVFSS